MDNVVNLRGLHNFGQKVTFRRRLTGMSQKKRKPVPTPQAKTKPAGKKTSPEDPDLSFTLIRFDQKVWWFLGACVALFFLFVALKVHNSSIAAWNTVASDGGDPQRGVIWGKPRLIRSDEWQIYSSFILAQETKDFPIENKALGAGKTPLTFNLPTHFISNIAKPAFWGYYFLDIERAFAWQWNFKLFPFLIATFLLFMLLSGNQFGLSVVGSMWLFLSSSIQWWSIYTELFTYGFLSVLALLYILFGEKRYQVWISVPVLVLSAYSYAMVLYPAYQVPFAYALLALVVGYTWAYRKNLRHAFQQSGMVRVVALGVSFALLLALLFLFYNAAKETIHTMTETVYPGKRSETGGGFPFLNMFTDNFTWFMDDLKYPVSWNNICELSSFLMLSFLPMILFFADAVKKRKADPLLMGLAIFQVVILAYILIGFPGFLAKITLLSTSPSFRSFFIFGFVNIVFVILYLSRHRTALLPDTLIARMISFAGLFALAYGLNHMVNQQVESFFSGGQVLTASLLYSGFTWLLLYYHRSKWVKSVFLGLLAIFLFPNLRINPLSAGLSPYLDNKIFKTIKSIEAQDPGAGWVVFGAANTPNFLKAAGVNCFNGVQFAPPLDDLHVLDPEMKYDSIYNRFAHIGFTSLIQPNDSIEFALKQTDKYMIRMDPCSPRLTTLGIRYVMFTSEPHPFEISCMDPVASFPGHYIYKRREE